MVTRALRKDAGAAKTPFHNHVFRDFAGINTQAKRQAIRENEFAWIENVMPIGHGNAVIVLASSAALQTVASGVCYYMKSYNLAGVNYMFMATSTGHAYQVGLTSPYTRTEITTVGSPELADSGVNIAQWKNERILIGDPDTGLWSWNGSVLTHLTGTVPSVTIDDPGVGFTSVPTMVFTGGGGASAAGTATLTDVLATVNAAGAGYAAGDILNVTGGTRTVVTQLQITSVSGLGAITSFNIYAGGTYTVPPANPVAVTGGTGAAATFDLSYGIGAVTMTNIGTGYTSAPAVTFTGGAGSNALFTGVFSGAPTSIIAIETYSGRVWATFGRTLVYSAPDSYTDWSTENGGGSTIITDQTLHSDITQLISANNFLYFTGVDSVNVIGDVQVNSDGDTVFSNVNLSASIGTELALTLIPYFRSIWFANKSGIYSLFGSTPTKASDPLDGIVRNIDFDGAFSGGTIMLENILCTAFMFQYTEYGETRPLIALFFNKKWFLASQGDTLTLIASGAEDGLQNLYATDGTSFYKLFDDADANVDWTLISAYWDMKDLTRGKQATALGFEMNTPEISGVVTFSIDALSNQQPYSSSSPYDIDVIGFAQWINDAEEIVEWQNDALDVVDWIGSGYILLMQDGSNMGNYLGITMQSSTTRGSISSAMLRYEYRESW